MRRITKSDFDSLSDIYYRAVNVQLRPYYGEPQIEYYLKFPMDHEKFGKFIFETDTWLIESAGKPIGFGGVEDNGHITSLYVDPKFSRRGVGAKLLNQLICIAKDIDLDRIYTEANPFSKAFFLKNGFSFISEETRYRGEVPFVRYNMEFNC